jgi:hypothetical protein
MSIHARTDRHTAAPGCRFWQGERGWRLAAVLLLLLVAGLGCNPLTGLSYLISPYGANNLDPECALTLPERESKVVILCAHEDVAAVNSAFRDADQALTRRLAGMLEQRYKENGDKVKIIPPSKVLSYVREHPDWVTESKQEFGKRFDADFVVFLELGPMTMFEKGSNESLYRGNAEIRITVFDVHQPDGDALKYENHYSCVYPSTGPDDASSMSRPNFKFKFLDRCAKDLVLYFAAHPSKDKLDSE